MRGLLDAPPIPRPVALWRPAPRLAQGPWIEVKPRVEFRPEVKVEAPIQIGLGSLPLSLGLFAASGLTFLVRTALPPGWPQGTALVVGSGLAVAGIVNLILPKAEAAPPAPAAPPPPPPPGALLPPGPPPAAPGGAAAEAAPAYTPSGNMAFENATGRIVSPKDFSTVDIYPWSRSYPVRVQLHNPTQAPVTFEMELTADEEPHPTGSPAASALPVQVTLGPNQVRDIDVAMPIASWDALVDYVDVVLTARKRRLPGEPAQMLDSRSFVIE